MLHPSSFYDRVTSHLQHGLSRGTDIRATMVRFKAKVENLMAQMESALGSNPVPMLSL